MKHLILSTLSCLCLLVTMPATGGDLPLEIPDHPTYGEALELTDRYLEMADVLRQHYGDLSVLLQRQYDLLAEEQKTLPPNVPGDPRIINRIDELALEMLETSELALYMLANVTVLTEDLQAHQSATDFTCAREGDGLRCPMHLWGLPVSLDVIIGDEDGVFGLEYEGEPLVMIDDTSAQSENGALYGIRVDGELFVIGLGRAEKQFNVATLRMDVTLDQEQLRQLSMVRCVESSLSDDAYVCYIE